MRQFSHLVFYFCEGEYDIIQTPQIFRERVRDLAKAGYTGVELMVRDAQYVDIAMLQSALKENNLKVSAVGSGKVYTQDHLCFCSQYASVRQRAVQRIKNHIDLAVELEGNPPVILGSIRGGEPDVCQCGMLNVEDCLRQCAQYAAEKSARIAVEPITRLEISYINTVQEAVEMVERIGVSSLGIAIDSFNLDLEERDVSEAIRLAGKHIFYAQVADTRRYYPSWGHFDFDGFFKALKETGYQGFVGVEPEEYENGPVEDAKLGLEYLKKNYGDMI
ncbi:sugar phosphate isomerase/epimerase family protein [Youxingia wuxianensis]|uniref:Sugar phosphate isomerase/epimerase n=1 Tax=Youxingia wuxianensis TaxID=2763678 RepID=A0A926EQ68_9FIRM|nr:sugar phosphate isomerase/epimerase family protein [Youxingia wuxianensis]MBC8586133.1 sugar phosphate isomerase/epimerase [Youxingia wuxianensis]